MITVFNRRELFLTFNMEEHYRVKNILYNSGIEFYVHCQSRNFWSRGRTGSAGINQDYAYEYKFYVKRLDYEKALYLINKR